MSYQTHNQCQTSNTILQVKIMTLDGCSTVSTSCTKRQFFLLTALQFRFKNEILLFGIMIQYLLHQLSVQTFEVPLKSHHIYRQSSPHIHSLPPLTHLQSANTNLRFSS